MVNKKLFLLLLLWLGPCFGQIQIDVIPNWAFPYDRWCVVYTSGPNTGQPARFPGIGIIWQDAGWLAGSGGHAHDTGPPGGRQGQVPMIWPSGGTNTGQTYAEALTDTNGCAHFWYQMPQEAGYFYTEASIDPAQCNVPNVGCQTNTYSTLSLSATNLSSDFATFPIAESPTYGTPQFPGCLNYEPLIDSYHGLAGPTYLSITFPLQKICDWMGPVMQQAPLQLARASLVDGGYSDCALAGPCWSWGISDPHQWGYSMDVYSPDNSVGKDQLVIAMQQYCQDVGTQGEAIYDFYTHVSPTNSQFQDRNVYLWHIYCPQLRNANVYPN